MALKDIQLANITVVNRPEGLFDVTAYSDDSDVYAVFRCSSERDAVQLRNAIREHADCLKRVADYSR